MYDVIIIGSGPAGLSAAIYAGRAKFDTLIIEEKPMSGGQIVNTSEVDNYPGLPGVGGFELAQKMREHAQKSGVTFAKEQVVSVENKQEKKLVTTNQKQYEAKAVVRIDHFRGFDSYYAIPAKDKTARNGEWREGPGMDLFNALEKKLGRLNIIVEDLGYLTPSVKQLLKDTGFPGMKLIQFAFDSREESDYLPHTYQKNCVVYTGTHDNDTIMGWFKTAPKESVKYAKEYLRLNKEEGYNWGTMKAVWGCVGDMAIVPMQDILGIGSEGRMNTPSTLGMNWKWRAVDGQITSALAKKVCKNMEIYCRKRKTKEELEALETAE